jgi:Xaa-Pro aminopeptidase
MPQGLAFSATEFERRAGLVEEAMRADGLDALVAYSPSGQQGPAAYLSGYEPCLGLHDAAYFVLAPGSKPRCSLLTNAFWDHPRDRAWADEVFVTSGFAQKIVELLPPSLRRLGVAGYRVLPTPVYLALQQAFPLAEIVDATTLLMRVARVKSDAEVEVMRQVAAMTDAGGRAFLDAVDEGVNEREVLAAVEHAIRLSGADGLAYGVQIYSGAQVEVGIGFCVDRVLAPGDQVQVDCGALYHGYRGDLSRVTTVGDPSRQVRAIMEAAADMYEAMLRVARAGVPVAEMAQAAIAIAEAHGLEDYLYRSPNHASGIVGHGLGCWYCEDPEIFAEEESTLEANMVIVLEPILGVPGVGGAKIEDAVLVTADGAERLSALPLRTWPE